MLKSDLLKILNDIAPLDTQEEWDNSGMQINLGHEEVKKVLVALEVNNEVVAEAKLNGCDFILTHHPLYFMPMKAVDVESVGGRYTIELLKAGIEVYSSHTPFDKCPTGTNAYVLEKIGCTNIHPAIEDIAFEGLYEPVCNGDSCSMNVVTLQDVIDRLKSELGLPDGSIRYHGNLFAVIRKVGICTGAGSEFMNESWANGCDVFITGDTKHHEVTDAIELSKCFIDAGHAGTEECFAKNIAAQLRAKNLDIEIIESKATFSPYKYI